MRSSSPNYTSLRNDSRETIEITPDAMNGRSHYTVQPGETVTFLGGFSTQRFLIRTPKHTFQFKFPLSFGAQPTHFKGRQKHLYVFTRQHAIYPLDTDEAAVHNAAGFPLVPRSL
jgi:hypothetical protein